MRTKPGLDRRLKSERYIYQTLKMLNLFTKNDYKIGLFKNFKLAYGTHTYINIPTEQCVQNITL